MHFVYIFMESAILPKGRKLIFQYKAVGLYFAKSKILRSKSNSDSNLRFVVCSWLLTRNRAILRYTKTTLFI